MKTITKKLKQMNVKLKQLTPDLKEGLLRCLLDPISEFEKLGAVSTSEDGPVIFIDNQADVLAVGHLDYVYFNEKPDIDWKTGIISNTPQLDDRLGVWVILYLLPSINPDFKYDILLCDSEEVGRSTGQNWEFGEKQYNFGFEFDRAGTDTVLYQYDSPEWRESVSDISKIGRGAFSDISALEHLETKMMNIGVGYYAQHTPDCFAKLAETISMAESFLAWADDNAETVFKHTPSYMLPPVKEVNRYSGWDYYLDDEDDYQDEPRQYTDSPPWDYGDGAKSRSSEFDPVQCGICGNDTEQELICISCQYNAVRDVRDY